jgi:hypothetical protein
MKTFKSGIFILFATCFIQANRISPEPDVFVASSPCDGIPRSLLSIPATVDCELIKWNLTLYRDPRNQAPTLYKLSYTYGMSKPSTVDFINGGTNVEKEGKWTILKGPDNRVVYQLNQDTPKTSLSFVKLDDNLLHLLDRQGKLMIGNAAWSYTLNRK